MGKGLEDAKKRLKTGLGGTKLNGVNGKALNRLRIKLKGGKLDSSYTYVSNVRGTSGRRCKCKCSGWSAHWLKKTKLILSAQKCYVRGCSKNACVGAHVFVEGHGNTQMIVPFCGFHNSRALTIAMPLKSSALAKRAVPAYTLLT